MAHPLLEKLRNGELAGATSFTLSADLTEFPRELFVLEDSLEVIDLAKNRLDSLPEDFGRFKKLKIAFFSDNLFETFPSVLADCSNLGIVAFRNNRIHTIPENAIPVSTHWLTLTGNSIEKLPESMGTCTKLRKVALAGNRIEAIPESMKHCVNLELLRVSANRLREIPRWLIELPKLRWLAFSGNPCSYVPTESPQLEAIHWDSIELKETLGQGASGVISRAVCSHGEPHEVAVKLFKGEMTSDGNPADEMAACIAAGSHPHLVPLKGKIHFHPHKKEGVVLGLIPERFRVLGTPPSLESCTRDVFKDRKITQVQAETIYHGVKSAMDHLHEKGILHGDLYAHNTFFDESGHAILGDFGAATFFDPKCETSHLLMELDRRALEVLREDLMGIVS